MDDEINNVYIPVEPAGIQCLARQVNNVVGEKILLIHTGIPANQVRSIIECVVLETLEQLVSAEKCRDSA